MKLIILATISLFITISFSWWSINRIHLIKTWSIGGSVIAISPDGKLLATSSGPLKEILIGIVPVGGGTTVKLYSFPDEKLVRTIEAFAVTKIAFSPDNSLIAAGNGLGEIFIWRISDGQLLHSLKVSVIETNTSAFVDSLIFGQNGQILVSAMGGQIDVWRVSDGQLLYSLSHQTHCVADISPDGQILALSTGSSHTVTLYQLRDGTRLRHLEMYGKPKFSPDGQYLAILYDSGRKIGVYRREDYTLIGVVSGLERRPRDFAFSRDGRYLAATYMTGGYVGGVLIVPNFNIPERWHIALWPVAKLTSPYTFPQKISSQKKSFTSITFSPDGKTLVTGGDSIRLWRMPS